MGDDAQFVLHHFLEDEILLIMPVGLIEHEFAICALHGVGHCLGGCQGFTHGLFQENCQMMLQSRDGLLPVKEGRRSNHNHVRILLRIQHFAVIRIGSDFRIGLQRFAAAFLDRVRDGQQVEAAVCLNGGNVVAPGNASKP